MPDLSRITTSNGTTYTLKDEQARSDITQIRQDIVGGVKYIGVSETPITDGSSTNPIVIGSTSVTAVAGNLVLYAAKEFIWSDVDSKWHEFGDMGSLKALAFKDSATGAYAPAGTVSKPTATVSKTTVNISGIEAVGTLPVCTMPEFAMFVQNETLSFSWVDGSYTAGTLPTKGQAQAVVTDATVDVSTPTFTGTSSTISVS